MKEQLLTFLLYQREELKKEHIMIYLRLNANGKLFVGFEFAYPHLSYWDRKPMKVTSKKCHLNIDFDNITLQKYEKFMKGYERTLGEIRERQRTKKNKFQVIGLEFQGIMRDVTNYPLSPNQRKEVEEYMSNHNVTENEARYVLGFVPGDLPQVSVTDALEMVKEENPNVELTNETLKFYLNEIMKKCIPKPNPKFVMEILIKNVKPIE